MSEDSPTNYVNIIFWVIVGLLIIAVLQDLGRPGIPYDCPVNSEDC